MSVITAHRLCSVYIEDFSLLAYVHRSVLCICAVLGDLGQFG